MPFATRNAMYLRTSEQRILPMYLYLDERHVDWMSDFTLQHVIQDLRPLLREVLRGSGENGKKVNVKRGDTYQFCYFLRPTKVTEAVLLKHKEFHLQPPRSPSPIPDPIVKQSKAKRKRERDAGKGKSSRARTARSESVRSNAGNEEDEGDYDEEETASSSRSVSASPAPSVSRRSARIPTSEQPDSLRVANDQDADEDDDELREVADEDVLMVKEEPMDPLTFQHPPNEQQPAEEVQHEGDEKGDWKPVMHLHYTGFHTSASQLVVVVEPWPPLPESSYAPPSSRFSDRSTSYRSQSRAFARSTITVTPGPEGSNQRSSASVSIPNSRRGGTFTATPSIDATDREGTVSLDIPNSRSGGLGLGGRRRRMSATPLFMPAGTPFEEDDDDDHDNYEERLRRGKERLPTVSGSNEDDSMDVDLESDGALSMSNRLMASSQMGPSYMGGAGPEAEQEGEVSAVMGDEEEAGD